MKDDLSLIEKLTGTAKQDSYLSFCQRVSFVKTDLKLCALIFENGPCAAPCEPCEKPDIPLHEAICDCLEKFGAKGTFCVVGSTAENYPDDIGVDGKGLKFAHFPLYEADEEGGAFNVAAAMRHIALEGHEVASHGSAHIPFGRQGAPKGRASFGNMSDVIDDLSRLDEFCRENYALKIRLCTPPSDVVAIDGRMTAFDALTLMRYTCLGRKIDCGGINPCEGGFEEEVSAMTAPVLSALKENENSLCGAFIRLHDGCNTEGRTPVAAALPIILSALCEAGYKVVTASSLISLSPYSDINEEDDCFADVAYLRAMGRACVYEDNTVRPSRPITRGEAAMILAPQSAVLERINTLTSNPKTVNTFDDVPVRHPYSSAIKWASENTILQMIGGKFHPNRFLNRTEFNSIIAACGGRTSPLDSDRVTRGEFMKYYVRAVETARIRKAATK